MQNRYLTVFMMVLALLQPVASLASVCGMSAAGMQGAAPTGSTGDAAAAIVDQRPKASLPACHQEPIPTPVDTSHCDACSGGGDCTTACSMLSPVVTAAVFSPTLAPDDVRYQSVTPAVSTSPPSELYRPPRLS